MEHLSIDKLLLGIIELKNPLIIHKLSSINNPATKVAVALWLKHHV